MRGPPIDFPATDFLALHVANHQNQAQMCLKRKYILNQLTCPKKKFLQSKLDKMDLVSTTSSFKI